MRVNSSGRAVDFNLEKLWQISRDSAQAKIVDVFRIDDRCFPANQNFVAPVRLSKNCHFHFFPILVVNNLNLQKEFMP